MLAARKLIYVLDDNTSMLRGIKRLLTIHGFEVKLFDTVAALLGHGELGDALCIVLDINLSDGSGIALRHRLIDEGIDLPVIYITGNDNPATRMAAMESGCVAYLTKPFTAMSLIEPVERIFAGIAGRASHSSIA